MEVHSMMPQSAPQGQTEASPAPAEPQAQPLEQKPKESDPFDQKFAILSKKQKALFEKEKEIEEKARRVREIEEREALFDKNPLEYFNKRGKSIDDILKMAVGEDQTPESKIEMLEKKLAAIEKEKEENERKTKESEESRRQQEIIDNYKKDVKNEIEQDLERWEAIVATDSFEAVYEVILNYYQTHGEVPPTQWAADEVEKELVEQARKFSSLKKIGASQSQPGMGDKQEELKTALSEQKTAVPTITNNLVPEPQGQKQQRLLSDEESKAQVARLLRWNG